MSFDCLPLISVIVPVYNAERYLNCCIESVLSQTFPNFELLLIDDGSTDGSRKICEEYSRKDSRVHCVCQTNAGEFAARMGGVRQAEGELLYFLDADDEILPDTLAVMLAYMKDDVDIVIFETKEDRSYTVIEYMQALLCFKFWVVWGRLYRRKLFDGIEFDNSRYFRVGVDFLTNLMLLRNTTGKIICKPYHKYLYNVFNPNSVQLSHKHDYEYEKKMVMEVDKIISPFCSFSEIAYAVFCWKIVYLSGMMGLKYNINYDDLWIKEMLEESKCYNLNLKGKITIKAIHYPCFRYCFILEKKIKGVVRRLIKFSRLK